MYKKICIIICITILLLNIDIVYADLIKSNDKENITLDSPIEKKEKVITFNLQNFEKVDNYNIKKYKSREFIVKFKDECEIKLNKNNELLNLNSINEINKKHSVTSFKKLKDNNNPFFSRLFKVTVNDNKLIPFVLNKYINDPNVEYIEPNFKYKLYGYPVDPYFEEQWALNQTNDCDIDAPEAWDIETGNSDIVIAVLDTGVDYKHPDLEDNIWRNIDEIPDNNLDDDNNGYVDDTQGWNFINNNSNPMDDYFHGTQCAGIASAVANNSIGIAGVTWNCKIMPVKISENIQFYLDDIINGIIYAADNGADVISMSWGNYHSSTLLKEAIDYAYSKGVVLVAAAGNDNLYYKNFPAAFNNVIAVAATNDTDEKADFSNYGYWLDIAAPGVDILSTIPTKYNESYYSFNGTSTACPTVAGVVGLILSKNPNLNPDEVRSIIASSSDKINSKKFIGTGRINAHKSLQKTAKTTALIDYPKNGQEIKGKIKIRGTAKGEKFQRYIVSFGKGFYPDDYTILYNSTQPIENDNLAYWNTMQLDEGWYNIKLQVHNANKLYTVEKLVLINNINNTLYVNDNNLEGPWDGSLQHPYNNIIDANEQIGSEDTIYVFNGNYEQEKGIRIEKSINLIGENNKNTIISGGYNVIRVLAPRVKIDSFTIISKDSYKSIIISSSECVVSNNIITSFIPHHGGGIYIHHSFLNTIYFIYGNKIINNTITRNEYGIYIDFSTKNIISNNNFIDNLNDAFVFGIKYIYFDFPKMKKTNFSIENQWDGNYWDTWIGLKNRFLSKFPKAIEHDISMTIYFLKISELRKKMTAIPFIRVRHEFDKHPQFEPYESDSQVMQ